MPEVLVLCEGQTEREFCRSVLGGHLAAHGVDLAGTLVGKPQHKQGGIRPWTVYRRELLRLAGERDDRYVGLLVDYYGMPPSWPGRGDAPTMPVQKRGAHVETRLRASLERKLGERFLPCVQLHEFESLLFVDPKATAETVAVAGGASSAASGAGRLRKIKDDFCGDVEAIDDSPRTAPSKRIQSVFRGYNKVAWGVQAAKDVGVETLRAGCAWLDRWLTRLQSIGER